VNVWVLTCIIRAGHVTIELLPLAKLSGHHQKKSIIPDAAILSKEMAPPVLCLTPPPESRGSRGWLLLAAD
jgi:hypothetical protein